MAELGILASVIAVVGAGTKLSIVIFDFATSVGKAEREVQNVATEISNLCSVLKQLQMILERAHFQPSQTAIESAQRIIEQCSEVFSEINDIVGELRSSNGDEVFPVHTMDFVSKVKWTFSKKSKVLMLRSTLDACKSTLSVMLVTMLLAERVSQRRLSTDSTLIEEEQDKAVTRSLVIAQQCAVQQLEDYEDQVEKEQETAMRLPGLDHATTRPNLKVRRRSMGRLVKMFSGLSVITDLPTPSATPPRPPTRAERASIWLDSILAPLNEPQYPHPGKKRQKRISSVATENAPLQLLRKWTDQADNLNPNVQSHSPTQHHEQPEIWRTFSFSRPQTATVNGNILKSHDKTSTPTPGIEKTPNDLVSPKTARVQSLGFLRVVGVNGTIEPSSEVLTADDSYDAITAAILLEHGAVANLDDVILCVSYGGKTKVLKQSDKPLEILKQFEGLDIDLDPRLFIRRVQGSAA